METIGDIATEHHEELPGECARRAALLRSSRATVADLRALDERFAGRLDGLALARFEPDVALQPLATTDPDCACAATLILLALDDDGAWSRLERLVVSSAPDAQLGVARGLAWARTVRTDRLAARRDLAPIACLPALAAHGCPLDPEVLSLLAAAPIRTARIAAALTAAAGARDTRWLIALADDSDAEVRIASLTAAAWARSSWLPTRLRAARDVRELALWSAIAPSNDLDQIVARCADPTLGPERCGVLASAGSPHAVEALITIAAGTNAHDACSAGAALERVLGASIESDRMWTQRVDGDEVDAIFAQREPLPDPSRARHIWAELQPHLARSERIAAGTDLSIAETDILDVRSLWERAMRAAFRGEPGPRLGAFERLTAPLTPALPDGSSFTA
jgi:hypothetical protein